MTISRQFAVTSSKGFSEKSRHNCRYNVRISSLLSPATSLLMMPEPLIASAYRMQGKIPEAKRTLQAGMYQSILALINLLVPYLSSQLQQTEGFQIDCLRLQRHIPALLPDADKKLHRFPSSH